MRTTDGGFKDFKKDYTGVPIPGGSAIVDIINTVIYPVAWTAIIMPVDKACKQLIVNERDNMVWRLSAVSNGATFFTVTGSLAMEIAASEEQILFYAQTTTASGGDTGILEVILVD